MDALLFQKSGATSVELPGYTDPHTGETTFEHPLQEEIDQHNTAFFVQSYNLWVTVKRWGLPHGKGWAAERATVVDIINVLDNEDARYDRWEMDKRREEKD